MGIPLGCIYLKITIRASHLGQSQPQLASFYISDDYFSNGSKTFLDEREEKTPIDYWIELVQQCTDDIETNLYIICAVVERMLVLFGTTDSYFTCKVNSVLYQ